MKKDCTTGIQGTPAGREGEQSLIVSVSVEKRAERALGCKLSPSDWFVDSGASTHMTGVRHLFVNLDEEAYERSITTADDNRLGSKGVGSVKIDATSGCAVRSWTRYQFDFRQTARSKGFHDNFSQGPRIRDQRQ